MTNNFQWITPEVEVTKTTDGGLMLQNKVPLAEYPANLCLWLHQNAQKFPNKHFLRQRDGEGGWQGLSYAQTVGKVNQISQSKSQRCTAL